MGMSQSASELPENRQLAKGGRSCKYPLSRKGVRMSSLLLVIGESAGERPEKVTS